MSFTSIELHAASIGADVILQRFSGSSLAVNGPISQCTFGIDDDGFAYYDTTGPTSGEAAALGYDGSIASLFLDSRYAPDPHLMMLASVERWLRQPRTLDGGTRFGGHEPLVMAVLMLPGAETGRATRAVRVVSVPPGRPRQRASPTRSLPGHTAFGGRSAAVVRAARAPKPLERHASRRRTVARERPSVVVPADLQPARAAARAREAMSVAPVTEALPGPLVVGKLDRLQNLRALARSR